MPKTSGNAQKKPSPEDTLHTNIEAERVVLSYLIQGFKWLDDVTASDFAGEIEKTIWYAMRAIHPEGDDVERQRVVVELGEAKLKLVRLAYLVSLGPDYFVDGMKIERYVSKLHDATVKRLIQHHAHILETHVNLGDRSAAELVEMGAAAFAGMRETVDRHESIIETLPPIWSIEVALEWLWDGLIASETVNLFTGDSGGGKSTLLLKLAYLRATGGSFLGRAVKQGRALYIDKENPLCAIKDRLHRLHIPQHPNLTIWGSCHKPEPEGPGSVEVLRFAKRHQPFIVFDSKKAFDGGDEQDASETRRHMDLYRRLTVAGATVALLHNTGKSEGAKEYRGSSDLKASVDSAYLIERTDGTDSGAPLGALRLKPFKSRIAPSEPIRFSYVKGEFQTTDAAPRSNMEKLEDLIRLNPLRTQRQLIALAKPMGIPKNLIGGLLLDGYQAGRFAFKPGRSGAQKWQLCEPNSD